MVEESDTPFPTSVASVLGNGKRVGDWEGDGGLGRAGFSPPPTEWLSPPGRSVCQVRKTLEENAWSYCFVGRRRRKAGPRCSVPVKPARKRARGAARTFAAAPPICWGI